METLSGLVLLLSFIIENTVYNAKGVDPVRTQRSTAFDLGLQCLLMSLLSDARHKWGHEKVMYNHPKIVTFLMSCLKCIQSP